MACNLLRCSVAELFDQRELFGQLLETFVFGEIEKQASIHSERIALHHLRDKDGYEVDIVIQRGTSHIGIEIKAASSVREGDFRGLKRLREILGSRFHSGIVLYDGENVLPFGDRFLAVPISALWAGSKRLAAARLSDYPAEPGCETRSAFFTYGAPAEGLRLERQQTNY